MTGQVECKTGGQVGCNFAGAKEHSWVAGVVLPVRERDQVLLTRPRWLRGRYLAGHRAGCLEGADLLAALGELVAFKDGDRVSELLDDRFITMDLAALGVDLGHQLRSQYAQLFGGHLVEMGQGNYAVDITKEARVL